MRNILAYVKHEMSADDYIWQVFNVPNDVDNVINYLTSRGYSTKDYHVQENTRTIKPRTKRVKPISGGQHLADVWRRSVISTCGDVAD
jgi:hypothetical protein